MAVQDADDRGGALDREQRVEDRVVAGGQAWRACSARKIRSAEVRQTTSVGMPAASSSSAAASTSGRIAPTPTSVTAGAPGASRRR
jgi:hypothetical protein